MLSPSHLYQKKKKKVETKKVASKILEHAKSINLPCISLVSMYMIGFYVYDWFQYKWKISLKWVHIYAVIPKIVEKTKYHLF